MDDDDLCNKTCEQRALPCDAAEIGVRASEEFNPNCRGFWQGGELIVRLSKAITDDLKDKRKRGCVGMMLDDVKKERIRRRRRKHGRSKYF